MQDQFYFKLGKNSQLLQLPRLIMNFKTLKRFIIIFFVLFFRQNDFYFSIFDLLKFYLAVLQNKIIYNRQVE